MFRYKKSWVQHLSRVTSPIDARTLIYMQLIWTKKIWQTELYISSIISILLSTAENNTLFYSYLR
jgi:hypothetical protein